MVKGIKVCRNDTEFAFNHYIKEILQSKTVEEAMEAKRDLLSQLLDYVFPLSTDSCYFCIDTKYNCKICKFAKLHKKCETNKKSDYNKIMTALDKLDLAFMNYYRSEVYPEDNPTKENRNRKKNDKHPG